MPAAPRSQHHSVLALWHLLSLDAPTVAALWTWFVAHCCHVHLPWISPASMFVAVWMLYAADRLLDARAARSRHHDSPLEERHRFHAGYQRTFIAGIFICAIALASMLFRTTVKDLQLYSALGSLLFAYFFLIHLLPLSTAPPSPSAGNRLPKELAVGVFFAAAVFIPTVSRAPYLRLALLPVALIFATTCTLNCLYIYSWEHPEAPRFAHWTTRLALSRLLPCTTALVIASLLFTSLLLNQRLPGAPPDLAYLPLACGLSVFSFLLLNRVRRKVRRTTLRAAVDLALLTPALLVPFMHLFR